MSRIACSITFAACSSERLTEGVAMRCFSSSTALSVSSGYFMFQHFFGSTLVAKILRIGTVMDFFGNNFVFLIFFCTFAF